MVFLGAGAGGVGEEHEAFGGCGGDVFPCLEGAAEESEVETVWVSDGCCRERGRVVRYEE